MAYLDAKVYVERKLERHIPSPTKCHMLNFLLYASEDDEAGTQVKMSEGIQTHKMVQKLKMRDESSIGVSGFASNLSK